MKAIAIAGGVVLTSVALVACAALVVLTTFMKHETAQLADAAARIRTVESLRTALLAYGRQSDLAYLGSGWHADARATAETQLIARLQDGRATASEPEEQALIGQAETEIREYLDVRRRAERQNGSVRRVLLQATPPLEKALGALDQLAGRDYDRAAAAHEAARRWDAIGNVVGIAVASLLLVGLVGALVGLQRLVFRPIFTLSDTIRTFGVGGPQQRPVVVGGPAELRRMADAFNAMAERLAQHEASRRTFLAGIAHDLRNPLGALRMRIQWAQRRERQLDEDDLRRVLALVAGQIGRLERMVGDFLDANQIESGHIELHRRPYDLRDAAAEAVRLYESTTARHHLTLAIPSAPVTVQCDPVRIDQVLNNLVSNAIKYSPHGGPIAVRLAVEADEAVLSVEDHGVGIAASDLEHIFEPFRRTGPSRETIPGVGLGLSVVRRIVEAHGGRIEVESAPGVGSTFTVRLPVYAEGVQHAGEWRS